MPWFMMRRGYGPPPTGRTTKANMGSGVIKAQISSRTCCTAGRSAPEADDTIAAKHANIKETIRKTFPAFCFSPPLSVSRNEYLSPSVFRFEAQFVDLHQ